MKPKPNYLAASLDGERKKRSGFGKGIGGPAKTPVRPGVNPKPQFSGGSANAERYPGGAGNTAKTPIRPGVSPAPRQAFAKRGGDQQTGGQRGRKDAGSAQRADQGNQLGVKSRNPSL